MSKARDMADLLAKSDRDVVTSLTTLTDPDYKSSATEEYTSAADLPLVDNEVGDQAYVSATNRLYLWNGSGWFNIALINTSPTITQGGDASYSLATDGTPTVITLLAEDPEELDVTWSYAVTTGSLGTTATVTQADNVFTITPSTDTNDVGDFSITFTASDGINLSTSVSAFSLVFTPPYAPPSSYFTDTSLGTIQSSSLGDHMTTDYSANLDSYNLGNSNGLAIQFFYTHKAIITSSIFV